MTKVKFTSNLKKDGTRFTTGQVAEVESEESLKELLDLGVVEVIDESAAEKSSAGDNGDKTQTETPDATANDGVQTPPAPDTTTPPAEESVNTTPLEGQDSGAASQAPGTESAQGSSEGNPTPEQIAQTVANI